MTAAVLLSRKQIEHGLRRTDPSRDLAVVGELMQEAFGPELDASGRRMVREMKRYGRYGWLGWILARIMIPTAAFPRGYVWVEDGHVVGNAHTLRVPGFSRRWVIANVAVAKAYQRRGIATRLVEACIGDIRRQGAEEIILQVREKNEGARRLYEQLQFTIASTRTDWLCPQDGSYAPLPQTPYIRPRRHGEWHQQVELARLQYPEGLVWPLPSIESFYKPNALGLDFRSHWVWVEQERMLASISLVSGMNMNEWFVVLAAVGWEYIISFRKRAFLLIILLIILMLKPAFWMIKNHPFQNVYFNEIVGGLNGAYSNYETDFLSFSGKQAMEWLLKNEDILSIQKLIVSNIETETLKYYADKHEHKLDIRWTRGYNLGELNWDYAILTSRSMSKTQIQNKAFPPKGSIHTIYADEVPLISIVKKSHEHNFLGYKFIKEQTFDSAVFHFQKSLEFDSMNAEIHCMLGAAYSSLKNYSMAEKHLRRSVDLFPENFVAYDYLGYLYFLRGETDNAFKQYFKSYQTRNSYLSAIINISKTYAFEKEYDSAVFWLNKAIKVKPDESLYEMLGDIYLLKNEISKAINAYNFALSINPENKKVILKKQNLLKKQGEIIYMESAYKNQQRDYEYAEKLFNKGLFDSAIIIYDLILKTDSTNVAVILAKSIVLMEKSAYGRAIDQLLVGMKLDSQNFTIMYNLGVCYAQLQKYNKALLYYDKAIRINPLSSEAYNEKSVVFINMNNLNKAKTMCDSALLINPTSDRALYSRAWISKTKGNYKASLDDLNKLLSLNPSHGNAYNLRALIYYARKKYQLALEDVLSAQKCGVHVDPKFVNHLQSLNKTIK